jgi:hypothetical protein
LRLPSGHQRQETQAIVAEVRTWGIHRMSDKDLPDLARMFNQKIRGWIAYYGKFYPSALHRVLKSQGIGP